jgi:hypothetical protein
MVHYQESNDSWRREKWDIIANCHAIKRIQYNTTKMKKYIIIDIDSDKLFNFLKADLPKPNFILKNKHKVGGHLFYVLDRPITHKYYEAKWKKVQQGFSEILGGDPLNKGFIGKNLNNNIDFEYIEYEVESYNIDDLYEYLPKQEFKTVHISSRKLFNTQDKPKYDKTLFGVVGERNVSLFNELRQVGYQLIKKSYNDDDFWTCLINEALEINNKFLLPLDEKEVEKTTRSIYKYCVDNRTTIKNNTNKGVMELDSDMDIKEKQKLGALYSASVKNSKTEMKLKVALIEMKKQDIKINISSVARYTKMSKNTIKKYKNLLS